MYPPCAFELSLLLLTIIHKIFGKIISKKKQENNMVMILNMIKTHSLANEFGMQSKHNIKNT